MVRGNQDESRRLPALPDGTARAARAVCQIENLYLTVGDNLDRLLEGVPLSSLDAESTHHPRTQTLLALVTVFQFAEDLADRQASLELVRRTDWKYALHLPLQCMGLDPALLCDFRRRAFNNSAGIETFQQLLRRFSAQGFFSRSKRDVGANGVLQYLCRLNQLDRTFEAVSQAIEALAFNHPDLLRSIAAPHWYRRYQDHQNGFRPHSEAELQACADALGADTHDLLASIKESRDPRLGELPEVRQLSTVWSLQYELRGTIWRDASCRTCPWLAEESDRPRS